MNHNERKPLYYQIKQYLYRLVYANLKKGELKIPSENLIAQQFNVSRITSKRAINDLVEEGFLIRKRGSGTFINADIDEKLLSDLAQCGDTPAIQPTVKSKKTVALIVPDIKSKYMLNLVDGVQSLAMKNDWNVILAVTMYDQTLEETLIIKLLSSANALIIFPVKKRTYNQEILKLSLRQFPLAVIDNVLHGVETSTITSNNRKAAYNATKHFLKKGKKHIGIISQPFESAISLLERYKGYEEALTDSNIPIYKNYILDNFEHYGQTSFQKIADFINENKNIDSLIAFNYELGIKAINVSQASNIRLTNNDIIVFDEEFSEIYNLLKIKIKYIQQDSYKIGETAFQVILDQINSPNYLTQHITIDTKLFV
jgi:DNA-binding LacI/PurR family transcriptional regulator